MIENKVSEFVYKPAEKILGFAIKRANFINLIGKSYGKDLQTVIKKNYLENIRKPVCMHREIEARKFTNRMDFVDLTAFGVGVNFKDNDSYKDEVNKIDKGLIRYCNRFGNLLSRLEEFDEHLN